MQNFIHTAEFVRQRDGGVGAVFARGGGAYRDDLYHIEWTELTSLKKLYEAWKDFSAGKLQKRDVISFAANVEEELLSLQQDLFSGAYTHGPYRRFVVHDPKRREIHTSTIRDRVAHKWLYNYLLPIFDRVWLECSFSCRPNKGQHFSIQRVARAIRQATGNYTRKFWSVKCDIKKFFYHIDHNILFSLLCRRVRNPMVQEILWKVIDSWSYPATARGIPIGNLTSQIFANVYLHELDIFAKHHLRACQYYRYADDFVLFYETIAEAELAVKAIGDYVLQRLHLELHPDKIIFRPCHQGVDWLGTVFVPGHSVLRPTTRRRMMRNISRRARTADDADLLDGLLASYNGLLKNVARKSADEEIAQIVALYGGMC